MTQIWKKIKHGLYITQISSFFVEIKESNPNDFFNKNVVEINYRKCNKKIYNFLDLINYDDKIYRIPISVVVYFQYYLDLVVYTFILEIHQNYTKCRIIFNDLPRKKRANLVLNIEHRQSVRTLHKQIFTDIIVNYFINIDRSNEFVGSISDL